MRKTSIISIPPTSGRVKSNLWQCFIIVFVLCLFTNLGFAQNLGTTDQAEAAYLQTITQRSNKIVSILGLTDSAKFYRVQTVLVNQYRILNTTHDAINSKIKQIKNDSIIDKTVKAEKIRLLEEERLGSTASLHQVFIKNLSADLSSDQILLIKDGVTYNILPVTYKAYQEMIPQLSEQQKKKIYDWLVEAREYAMDAESSEKKHAWFGKYKGRINNYLSAEGIDMKKEEAEWQKRIKEKKLSNNKA